MVPATMAWLRQHRRALVAWLKDWQNINLDQDEWTLKEVLFVSGGVLLAFILLTCVLYVWVASRQVRPRKLSLPDDDDTRSPLFRGKRKRSLRSALSSLASSSLGSSGNHSRGSAMFRRRRAASFSDLPRLLEKDMTSQIEPGPSIMLTSWDQPQKKKFAFPPSLVQKFSHQQLKLIYDTFAKVFSILEHGFVEELAEHLEVVEYQPGQTIFEMGEHDGSILIVASGLATLCLHSEDDLSEIFEKTVETSECITSSLPLVAALMQHAKQDRSNPLESDEDLLAKACGKLSSRALQETQVLRIPFEAVHVVIHTYPNVLFRLCQVTLTQMEKITCNALLEHFGLVNAIVTPAQFVTKAHYARIAGNDEDSLSSGSTSPDTTPGSTPSPSPSKKRQTQQARRNGNLKISTHPDTSKTSSKVNTSLVHQHSRVNTSPVSEEVEHHARAVAEAFGLRDESLILQFVQAAKWIENKEKVPKIIEEGVLSFSGVYVVIKGSVSVRVAMQNQFVTLYEAKRGCEIGLAPCFLGNHVMTTKLVCKPKSKLLWIPAPFVTRLLTTSPVVDACVGHLLQQYSPLACITDSSFKWIHLHSGEKLYEQGDDCDALFIILSGRVRVLHEHFEQGRPIKTAGELVRGATLGALDMLARSQLTSTVFAIRDSQISKMPRNVFDYIVQRYPKVLVHFTMILAQRIPRRPTQELSRFTSTQVREDYNKNTLSIGEENIMMSPTLRGCFPKKKTLPVSTIAVVSLTRNSHIKNFCSQLLLTLNKSIAVTDLVSSQRAQAILGDDWATESLLSHANLSAWLGEVESSHELVLYEADEQLNSWTRLCLRQADHIVLLCPETEMEEQAEKDWQLHLHFKVKEMEELLVTAWQKRNVNISLIRVREENWASKVLATNSQKKHWRRGTASSVKHFLKVMQTKIKRRFRPTKQFSLYGEKCDWITSFHNIHQPFDHHMGDFERLARRITGKSIGLVLGGGGAKGLAHIGVIKALNECGIEVDVVGGTSIGACLGAIYATAPDDFNYLVSRTQMLSNSMSSIWEKLLDLTLPIASFFSGKKFNEGIRQVIGDLKIEEFVLNFFCISTDLAQSRMAVHRSGDAWKYVRASMSLQGYLPPISEEGSLLVDGGYMNNLPADVMKEQGGVRHVIAVDVGWEPCREYYDYGTALSGWWLLWNRLNPFAETVNVPSMGDLSAGLAFVCSIQHRYRMKEEVIDLYLKPPVQGYSILQFDKMDELVQLGYDYALPLVKRFKQQLDEENGVHGAMPSDDVDGFNLNSYVLPPSASSSSLPTLPTLPIASSSGTPASSASTDSTLVVDELLPPLSPLVHRRPLAKLRRDDADPFSPSSSATTVSSSSSSFGLPNGALSPAMHTPKRLKSC